MEESQAMVDIWKYVFAFTPMAALKCAIQLKIPEILESHGGGPITLADLSAAVGCSPPSLRRIMRFLIHHGFFKRAHVAGDGEESPESYIQTPMSKLLLANSSSTLAAFILLESSPVMLAPWHSLSYRVLANGPPPFTAAHGEDLWDYAAGNPDHSKLINDAMSCHARIAMSAIIEQYPEAFKGISSLVDVGGGDGTALQTLVKACPRIRGINLDLPHVVSVAPRCEGVEHVGGDMFESVPLADAAFLMWVLHDWSDDECINILSNCRAAIPKDTGKVIIVEAVIREGEDDEYSEVRLALDMVMMAHTKKGKERTSKEWEYVVRGAGFTKYTEKRIQAVVSVIEAYP